MTGVAGWWGKTMKEADTTTEQKGEACPLGKGCITGNYPAGRLGWVGGDFG